MKEVLIGICASAVITAVFKALIPDPKFSSQIKLLLSCFFILSVIGLCGRAAGGKLEESIDDIFSDEKNYNDYSVIIERMTADETAANLKKEIKEALSEENIFPEKIYIDVNISDRGSISIIEIKLVFTERDHSLYAQRAVETAERLTNGRIKVTAEIK